MKSLTNKAHVRLDSQERCGHRKSLVATVFLFNRKESGLMGKGAAR
jgi:hypothetical protein